MRKLIVSLALFLSCTAQQFNPPYVSSDQVVPGASAGNCLKANPGGYIQFGACGAGGATVPNPNAVGQTIFSADGTTFSLLGIGSNGQCLLVSAGVPSWGACGGGGPTLDGNNTWTGVNEFDSPSGQTNIGPVSTDFNLLGFGSTSTGSGYIFVGTETGNTPLLGVTCDFTVTDNSNLKLCGQSSNGALATKGSLVLGGQLLFGNVNTGPRIQIGTAGAPAGACVNGSIYTRSDGSVGAALYVCYGAVWHASAT